MTTTKVWLERSVQRQRELAERLGKGSAGPIRRDRATRPVLDALDRDLDTSSAIRALERSARTADHAGRRSLRGVARDVLGIL